MPNSGNFVTSDIREWSRQELNGGRVEGQASAYSLSLPGDLRGYGNAQLDDYSGLRRREYPHRPGITLSVQARFSHADEELKGTAGFGFWNAPFGDPTVRTPALPQAAWFFYASPPSDLPLAPNGVGRGWFAGTIDASSPRAVTLIPFAPLVLLLNQFGGVRKRLWPGIQQRLGISFAPVEASMTEWQAYRLSWQRESCSFYVNNELLLTTSFVPQGPLGFVCWLDNQFLVATSTGRFRWGTLSSSAEQCLEIRELGLKVADGGS